MNHYITGQSIKNLREQLKMTQMDLGNILGVSDKTISKWETSKGLPDVTLIEPLAQALHVSVIELLSGESVINTNRSSNLLRSHFYVCPVCGNIVYTTGDTLVSCCGITLPALEAEEMESEHQIRCERIDDRYHVSVPHEMTKNHHLSFLAYVTTNRCDIVKLYAEGNAEADFMMAGHGRFYAYCNKHGLFQVKL